MGQYHYLCTTDEQEFIDPHYLGAGLKMGEQVFTFAGVRAALAALVSRRPGNLPADCGNSPMIGRWAGSKILSIGDYLRRRKAPSLRAGI